ncbi:MAG TPA: DUF1059 domain-containing protein [Gammaproteobacteria bacterium]|nr:DUF1059 domain-containing protein [Gammaproteobacteria bacterium]
MAEARMYIDCRETPSEANCSLYISGSEEEVLDTARRHAVAKHGHADSPELVSELKAALKAEA